MGSVIPFLAGNPLFLLFLIIGVGYVLGSIRVFGFSLGVSAVLFVGIAAGAVDPRLNLPEYVYLIGLVLFVYMIGLQSGPVFFASFRKRGLRINGLAVGVLLAAAVLAVVLWKALHLSVPAVAGLFCGSLTNTPALAASVETLKGLAAHVKPGDVQAFVNGPVVTYGLAYPFGVFGMIFWMFLFAKVFKIDFAREEAESLRESGTGAILSWTFLVTNPALDGRTVREALEFFSPPGFVLSRILHVHDGRAELVTGDTRLRLSDKVVAVGDVKSLERARLLFGRRTEDFEAGLGSFVFQRIFVSRSSVIGKRIGELDLQKRFGATITRVRRGDVQFVPSAETVLESGDGLRIMSKEENLEALKTYLGDSVKAMSESDFLPLSAGILLGVLVGMIPIPLPNGGVLKLGFAGGPLLVSLILGKIERTSSIAWRIPFNANIALRQFGLVLFLAAIGTKAGHGLLETVRSGGLWVIAAGAFLTTFVAVTVLLVGHKAFKLPLSSVTGILAGIQTQPACLAYANQQAENDLPNVGYATVYPAAMVAKILFVQVMISMLILL
jgi:putative transport protein